ncbi:MAG: phospholipase A [Methylophaga sp.]|nr:phospholipase A [Methylophaga sp.]
MIFRSFAAALLFISTASHAASEMERCMMDRIVTAEDTLTVGDIRRLCALYTAPDVEADQQYGQMLDTDVIAEQESALGRRLMLEKAESRNPFVLLPHRPNYIILSNNMASANERPFELADPGRGYNFQPWETKFQISLKLPVARGLFDDRADLYFAYTNRSFWQMFNKSGSSPFRDSNHEPEAWLSFATDNEVFGFRNSMINTGINHHSNGQSGPLSRSWNRLFAEFVFEHDDLYLSLKPWWRIPERSRDDDNPDIERYMGNFELGALYKMGNHSLDLMLRNNLRGNNKGAVQLGWSFPLFRNFRGYMQWFNGYGESLIDYDHRTNSLGIGIQFSDWL